MSDVRRRFALPLLTLSFLLFATCQTAPEPDPSPIRPLVTPHNCAPGLGLDRKEAPVICVDDVGGTLSVHPDRIVAWDKTPASSQNTLQWITRSNSGDLRIEFKGKGCVEDRVECDGKGHCSVRTKPVLRKAACKYDVIVGTRRLDPEAVIIKCCSAEEPPG